MTEQAKIDQDKKELITEDDSTEKSVSVKKPSEVLVTEKETSTDDIETKEEVKGKPSKEEKAEEKKESPSEKKKKKPAEKKDMKSRDQKKLSISAADIRKGIAEIKNELRDANEEKEKWYEKRETLRKHIREKLSDMGSHKRERNLFTDHVKEQKKKREGLTKELREKISAFKVVEEKKKEISKRTGAKDGKDPYRLKKDIETIEYKLETEPISFSAEKKQMKRLKEMKKRYLESKELIDILEKQRNLSREIKKLKKDTNETHRSMQTEANKSQSKHLEMINMADGVDKLKKEEEDVYKKFFDAKKKYAEINARLKDQYIELRKIEGKLDDIVAEKKAKTKKKVERELKEKEVAVEEKIKKRMKLTTEDLLVFQKQMQKD